MKYLIDKATQLVETETLRLAARNLQHLIKINEEEVTLDNIVTSMQKTIADTKSDTPEELEDILVTQARILDGAFLYFLDKSKNAYTEHEKVDMALKAHKQMLSAVNTMRHLKQQRLKEHEKNLKIEKQTEQKRGRYAPMDG